jgi:hypothetical protein
MVQSVRPQLTIRSTYIACWIPEATDTYSEYVLLIAFPPQQWLNERASVLPYTRIVCFVNSPTRRRCLFNFTLRLLYPRERTPVTIGQE